MASDNKLELVVEVDVNKANASIKSINTGLSSMEQAAGKAARGASAGIDGFTVSMVKGSTAGNLLAGSNEKALDWAKEWTLGAAQYAAHTDKMSMSMTALAKAHGVSAEASNRAVEAVKKAGFGTQDAIHAADRLMVADMNLSKAEKLAKVAKDAAAIENITPGEALEKLLMASEKFGGPLGAAIGAGVGFVAGVVRLFVKGATEKARRKIKDLYGVDISDKGVLQQIVDMAKSGFGGNLDMAIRSPQIRDLIQLYAMTTGQKTTGMPGTVTPLSLVETGGSLFQSPQYNNGTPLPGLGGLPGLDQIGAGTPSGGGLVIQLDGPATTALLQGQAVQAITNNPRLVQSASMAATKSSANRRELTSLQLSPGTIVS